LLFDLLASQRKVGVPESAFREISRIALASLAFSLVGIWAVIGLHALDSDWAPALDKAVTDKAYLSSHVRQVAIAATIGTVVSLAAAWLTNLIVRRTQKAPKLGSDSLWTEALRRDVPEGTYPMVWVRLLSGQTYLGRLRSYTADLDLADRELSLAPPLFLELPGREALVPLDDQGWQRMVFPGTAIAALAVVYRPDVQPPRGGRVDSDGDGPENPSPTPFAVEAAPVHPPVIEDL
jgi:hypothetical protein